ncbi:MAG: alpha/beta hydrolase [Planctomycetes bacterium]|nr:alpha/beta hydrolase [Planctomycetota bacterium]
MSAGSISRRVGWWLGFVGAFIAAGPVALAGEQSAPPGDNATPATPPAPDKAAGAKPGAEGVAEKTPEEAAGEDVMREAFERLSRPRGAKTRPEELVPPTPDLKGKVIETGRGRHAVRKLTDIAYHEGADAHPTKHRLDLFLPEGLKAGLPTVIFIHGGGWMSGDKRMYGNVGKAFAREGFATVLISYRLSPEVLHPEHARDCARAVAFVVKNIGRFGGDGKHFFLTGHSAGGHLTALLATNRRFLKEQGLTGEEITAAAPLSGVYRVAMNLFGAFGTDREVMQDASPMRHVSREVCPMRLFVGDNDYPSLIPDAKVFHEQLVAAGADARLTTVKNRNHLSLVMRIGMTGDETTAAMLAFFRSFLPADSPAQPAARANEEEF